MAVYRLLNMRLFECVEIIILTNLQLRCIDIHSRCQGATEAYCFHYIAFLDLTYSLYGEAFGVIINKHVFVTVTLSGDHGHLSDKQVIAD